MYPYAGQTSTEYTADRLVVGGLQQLHGEKMRLVAGNLKRGTVVGLVLGTVTALAAAGNGGNGAIGTVTLGVGAMSGVYNIVIVEPAADAGNFIVEDPNGQIIGGGTVGVAFAGPINFTLADGGNNWVAKDRITVTVALADRDVKQCAAAATDGSQIPWGVLAVDADATDDEVECLVYDRGAFNEHALILGSGITLDAIREPLRARGIYLEAVQQL